MKNPIRTAEDAKDLVRGLDKHSGGAASVTTQTINVGPKRTETWTAILRRGINDKIYIIQARKTHGKKLHNQDIPKHVREYLAAFDDLHPNTTSLTREEFEGLEPDGHPQKVKRPDPLTAVVTFQVEFQPTRQAEGISVFCEVGDSGEGVSDFIPFPTDERTVCQAMESVISSARDAEVDAGWNDEEAES